MVRGDLQVQKFSSDRARVSVRVSCISCNYDCLWYLIECTEWYIGIIELFIACSLSPSYFIRSLLVESAAIASQIWLSS
jgi:hypothetical protein